MIGVREVSVRQASAIAPPLASMNIWEGSVRSGKTVAAALAWAKFLIRDAPVRGDFAITGKTEPILIRNVLHPMLEMFGRKHVRINRGISEAHLFGRRHYLIGANDERSESKVRGLTLAGILADEVTLYPESLFDMLQTRLSVPGAAFLGTTNPDSPLHWLAAKWLARSDELGLRHERFRLRDNTFLEPEFVARLETEFAGLFRRRYIDGEWVVAEGAVYPMADLGTIVRPGAHAEMELPELVEHWACGDFGTTNPTVYLMISLGTDARLHVHHEYRHDSRRGGGEKTVGEYSAAFREWRTAVGMELRGAPIEPRRMYLDPSAKVLSVQLWRDGERHVVPADNAVADGIAELTMLLAADRIRFHLPSLVDLPGELAGYTWDPKATKRGEDKPIKVGDHGPDALRYGIRGVRNIWKPWVSAPAPERESIEGPQEWK